MALVFLFWLMQFVSPFLSTLFFRDCPTLPSTRELFAQGFEVSFLGEGLSFPLSFSIVGCAICLPACLSLVQVEGFVSGSTSLNRQESPG